MEMADHPQRNLINFDPVPLSMASSGNYGKSISWIASGNVNPNVYN